MDYCTRALPFRQLSEQKKKPPYIVPPNRIGTYMMVCFSCIYRLFKLFGAFSQPLEKYIFCEILPEHIFFSD